MRMAARLGEPTAPAQSYAERRQQLMLAAFPFLAVVAAATTVLYASIDFWRVPGGSARLTTYAIEFAVPLLGLAFMRSRRGAHADAIALATDLVFTAVVAGRLFLPATTVSGTALVLSLKLLGTALLCPWPPRVQGLSATGTLLLYYGVLALTGRSADETHELAGPVVAALVSLAGAVVTDRIRRTLWQQGVDLAASEQRIRAILESERILGAIAREISVLTDLQTTLERVNTLTAAALGCEFSNTYVFDGERREFTAAATNAADPACRTRILAERLSLDIPLVQELHAGRGVVINDIHAQPWVDPARLAAGGVRRVALMPMVAKQQVLGVLSITRTDTIARFEERDIALLGAIADQAAIAIENARLFDGLAASEARYRDLFERSTDLIFVVDEGGQLRFANRAALDFVRVSPDELRSLRWQDLVSDHSRRLVERRIAASRRRRPDAVSTFEIDVHAPGAPEAVLEVRTRIVSPPGQPRVYHCIARDVTERRQQERDTQQLLHRLREANRLQSEFVANMSHELRTPLNVIIGYADLLADDPGLPPESDGRLFLQRIATAGRALHRLVESVLEYARLDRGHHVIITTQFPATALLRELRDLCGDVSGNADVAVDVQESSDIVFSSDYDRLYSILSNLLLNALKFTAAGVVELRLRRIGHEAEFTVCDTGIGIDPAALPHVFEPFRQVDGSPTRSYGGVGLGLAIVRRNAEILQGRVEVESQVGVGTTFRVTIPIAYDASAQAQSAA